MNKDLLNQLWSKQPESRNTLSAQDIITKADRQRKGQYLSTAIMSITVLIVTGYAIYFATGWWNNFTIGLLLMIGSLLSRIVLELISIIKKERKLVALSHHQFKKYLHKHYKKRLVVNYIISPICFAVYTFGFYLLLPYFKEEFSDGFYDYLIVSGVLSLVFVCIIIVWSIIKEHQFLKALKDS